MYLHDDDCVALIVRSNMFDEYSQSLATPLICMRVILEASLLIPPNDPEPDVLPRSLMKRHSSMCTCGWKLNDRNVQCVHRSSGDIGIVVVDWLA